MRNALLSILFIGSWLGLDPSGPELAVEAFEGEEFEKASTLFQAALEDETYLGEAQALNYNVGQCLLRADSVTHARTWLSKAVVPTDRALNRNESAPVASWAYNNIAVIQVKSQPGVQIQGNNPMALSTSGQGAGDQKDQIQEALASLRDALRLDPDNDIARYNYELLMRRIQQQAEQEQEQKEDEEEQQQDEQQENEQKEQNQQDQEQDNEQDQQKENQPQPDNKENKGQNNPQNQDEQQASEQMDPQQAKRLLDAVNEKEKQFIQELEEARPKGRPRRTDGPDW